MTCHIICSHGHAERDRFRMHAQVEDTRAELTRSSEAAVLEARAQAEVQMRELRDLHESASQELISASAVLARELDSLRKSNTSYL